MIFADPNLPPLARGTETLNPNKYRGDFLIARYFGIGVADVRKLSVSDVMPIYSRKHSPYPYWCVPPVNRQPPIGYDWIEMGKIRNRSIYAATRRPKE